MAVDFNTTVTSSRALAQFPNAQGGTATTQVNPEDLQRQTDRGEFLVRTIALRDALVELEDLVANTRRNGDVDGIYRYRASLRY